VNRVASALVGLVGLSACATLSKNAGYRPPPVDTPEQAEAFLDTFRARYGGEFESPPPSGPVDSLVEAEAILVADALHRYPEARAYAETASGVRALVLRAALELTSVGAQRTVRDLLAERRTQLEAEQRLIGLRSVESEGDERRRAELDRRIKDFRQAERALDQLASLRLEAGGTLADEALRRFPNDGRAHFMSAMRYRLDRDWPDYGREARWLRSHDFHTPGTRYMRAMVEFERGGRLDEARRALEALTVEEPQLVRAQAQLVLLYEHIEDVRAELAQLRSVSPHHFVVRLVGQAIDDEWAGSREPRVDRRDGARSIAER